MAQRKLNQANLRSALLAQVAQKVYWAADVLLLRSKFGCGGRQETPPIYSRGDESLGEATALHGGGHKISVAPWTGCYSCAFSPYPKDNSILLIPSKG